MAIRQRGKKIINVKGTRPNTAARFRLLESQSKALFDRYHDRLGYVVIRDLGGNFLLECHKFDGKVKRIIKKMGRHNLIITWLDSTKGEFNEF